MNISPFLSQFRLSAAFLLVAGVSSTVAADAPPKPNIVYILCDDLGYGDMHALNPDRGKIPTPNLDHMAADGMAFTDCHSGSAVCTPSRYCILTGRYCWRTRLQSGVLGGMSKPLIAADRLTVAEMLKQQGYTTAAIGKWHLGMDIPKNDFSAQISDGPLQHGFDYFFGISASLDMPPYAYIENDHFAELPTVIKVFSSDVYGNISRGGPTRKGPAAPHFDPHQCLPALTGKAVDYIGARGSDKKPFFLYLALPSPHTPLVPTPQWRGKSGLGPYGDYVMETDWSVGEVLAAVDKAGLRDNTIVMLGSDNGCAPYIGVHKLEAAGHFPSAYFRGYKSDIWEGGHRIPFLVRWPGVIKPGSRCAQTIELTDLMATVAGILSTTLPPDAAPDSVDITPLLKGGVAPVHQWNVYHSIDGNFAIQEGKWKLELCPGSGGWSKPKNKQAWASNLPRVQLYDMSSDISEKTNVEARNPDVVARLVKDLEKCVADGRSTPGPHESNDAKIDIWKKPASAEKVAALRAVGD
ncbi:MAG TPA: arylsulfatase [Chthoniobacteraceae bacterium]|jgi:arylsulfatase A-like enzyme|nr:arylsulfatase [Chthoniobacteraceae bacterium]